jgi:hypothetical protein
MTDLPVDPGFFPPGVYIPLLPGGPTYEGFVAWVGALMAVPQESIPGEATLRAAYAEAVNLTYLGLATIPSYPGGPTIYAIAVYNLGGAILLEIARDAEGQTFWEDLRNKYGMNSFSYGLITSAADQGTSQGSMIPDQLQGMTLMDLQLLKSPWGRRYLMIAGQWGAIWGITY